MSLNRFKEDACLLTAQKHCPCVEFVLDDHRREGFHAGQLLHYRLEPNEGGNLDAPPERLTLAFTTADVVLTGRCLHHLTDAIRDGEFLAVRVTPSRYANLAPHMCFVSSITVTPIAKA